MLEMSAQRRPRVLLMDNDLSGSTGLCARLTLAGMCPVRAVDEVEALSATRNEDVDVAVLRLSAEYVSDTDLANILRQVASAAYLPVMILAGPDVEANRCTYLDNGADDVITAQTSSDEMLARLRALLRVKGLHDELDESRWALSEALTRERALLAKLRDDYEQLKHQATTDPLTHVQNVRSFREMLAHEFKVARRYNHAISMLMLDVDHFKIVNDTHGHPSGDYVLKELAVILKQAVRDSDVVARTGGEEFSVILPRAGRQEAWRFAERIRRHTYERQFNVYGRDIHVTISIGCATYPADAETTTPEMLVYFADQALLHAKETGRDRVFAFGEFDAETRGRMRRNHLAMRRATREEPTCDPLTPTDAPASP